MTIRDLIVEEALSWERTPYHHQGFIKGAGVDCAFFLIKVYFACGLIPDIDPRPYSPEWHLHRSEERYLGWVEQYARPVDAPLPGDIALFQFGRCVSHGAIVTGYPHIVHSYIGQGVVRDDLSKDHLRDRLAGFYRLKQFKD